MKDFKLQAGSHFSDLLRNQGIDSWSKTVNYIHLLPYERISDKQNVELVLLEKRGTCSSKHGFLKKIAEEQNRNDINLIIGIFKMSATNTPASEKLLNYNGIDYLPEAHSYLRQGKYTYDFTSLDINVNSFKEAILEEKIVSSEILISQKTAIHKAYLSSWLEQQNLDISLNQLWNIREACIQVISEQEKTSASVFSDHF